MLQFATYGCVNGQDGRRWLSVGYSFSGSRLSRWLVRPTITPTRDGLAQLALIRRQEIEGFFEGLFAGEEEADLPAKASAALDTLGEVRAMIAGVHEVAIDAGKPADLSDIATTMKHLRELIVSRRVV